MNWKTENYWVSPYNFVPEVTEEIKFLDKIEIHDATLRDGEQSPGVVFRKEEKVDIALRLADAGVHRIEVGMPAVSQEDRDAISMIVKENPKAELFAFARADPRDMQLCMDCCVDGVIIELPIGKPKLEHQFHYDIRHALEISQQAVVSAKSCGMKAVLFPYDATRCEMEDLEFFLNGLTGDCRPDAIGLVDTMGCAGPEAIAYLTKLYKAKLGIPVEIHVHNDFGMGLASSIAALKAGASVVHGCMNGLGERCGNVPTEEIVATLGLIYGQDLGVDIGKLVELAQVVEKYSGYMNGVKKPVTGKGNFVRESGIGADTIMQYPLAMFAVNPAYYHQKPSVVLGKKSGLLSVELKLSEMNVDLPRETRKKILGEVKDLGIAKKGLVTDEEFSEIVKKYC